MYSRHRHELVDRALRQMNAPLLEQTKCYFGGGTAIVLQLGEYRESLDLDFLCADRDGWRRLRESVFDNGLREIAGDGVRVLRDVRSEQDKVSAVLQIEEKPLKFEVILEARIGLAGVSIPPLHVPCLSRESLFAEKLLANADRAGDRSTSSRDLIDLLVMQKHWGPIPQEAWDTAESAYGTAVKKAVAKEMRALCDDAYRRQCFDRLGLDEHARAIVEQTIQRCRDPEPGIER